MLSLCNVGGRFGRREFLRVGGLALGGLSLADLLAARGAPAEADRLVTDKSVIFLYIEQAAVRHNVCAVTLDKGPRNNFARNANL